MTGLLIFSAGEKTNAVDIDLIQLLQSRESSVENNGDREEFYKAAWEWDIYNRAYSLAQLRVAGPAVRAVEATTEYITDRCDEVNVTIQDVSNILSHTNPGSLLLTTMDASDMFGDEVELGEFDDSCLKVLGCYYYDYLESQNIDVKDLVLSNNSADTCMGIVVDRFGIEQLRMTTIESLRDSNFGDELFANGEPTDAPYDLLVDVEQIWDLLFTHNDDPAEIHFYSMLPREQYVDNDPSAVTPYETEQPWRDQDDRTKRRVPSIGIPLQLPELPEWTYPPSDDLPVTPPTQEALEAPAQQWWLDAPAQGVIQNNMCIVPSLEPADENILEYAEEEFEETTTYNETLDLDERVAIALWAKLLPEVQVEMALDPAWAAILEDPAVQEQVEQLSSDDVMGKEWLEELEEALKQCVKDHTDKDERAFKKIIQKTLSQPTELSACATKAMCKEVGGEVGTNPSMWDYRIKVCKIPSKSSYGVVNNQPVVSIEEVIDEINNVCLGLKESGQLIEHNKTKDQRDHGLMRIKLWEKVAFSISVSFGPTRDDDDVVAEKRKRVEKNNYLQKTILWISENLSFEQERDKYIVIATPQPWDDIDLGAEAQFKWDEFYAQSKEWDWWDKAEEEQITHYAKFLDEMDMFLDYNTNLRWTINDYTHSLNASRQGEKSEFSKKTGK